MNCRNCGGIMTLLESKGYFKCPYCESLYFPTPTDEGVVVLKETDLTFDCPVCAVRLHHATISTFPLFACTRCRGLLIEADALTQVLTVERSRPRQKMPRFASLPEEEGERNFACPRCLKPMETHPYHGPGTFLVDSCGTCGMVWLDYGELNKAITAP